MDQADELKSCDELLEGAKDTGKEKTKRNINDTTPRAQKIQKEIEKEHLQLREQCGAFKAKEEAKDEGAVIHPKSCSEEFEKRVEEHLQKLKDIQGCLERLKEMFKEEEVEEEVKEVSPSAGPEEEQQEEQQEGQSQEEDSKSDSKAPQDSGEEQESVTTPEHNNVVTNITRAGAGNEVFGRCPEMLAKLKRNLVDEKGDEEDKKFISYYDSIFDYYFTQKKKTLRAGELSVNSSQDVQTNDLAIGQMVLGSWTTLAPAALAAPEDESEDIEEDCRKGILQAYAVTWERLVEDARTAAVGIVGVEGLSATEGWNNKDERFQKDRDSVHDLLLHAAVTAAIKNHGPSPEDASSATRPPLLKALYNMQKVVKTVHEQLTEVAKEADRLKSATTEKPSKILPPSYPESLREAASLYIWLDNSLDKWIPLAEESSKPWWKKPVVLIGGGGTIIILFLLFLWFFVLRKKEEEEDAEDAQPVSSDESDASDDPDSDTDDDFFGKPGDDCDGISTSSDDEHHGMWWRPDHQIAETESDASAINQNANANGVSVTTTTTTTKAVVTPAAKNTTTTTTSGAGAHAVSATLRADTQDRDRLRALLD